jgi:hypothetical protein
MATVIKAVKPAAAAEEAVQPSIAVQSSAPADEKPSSIAAPEVTDPSGVFIVDAAQQLMIDGDLGLDLINPEITSLIGEMVQTYGTWTKAHLYTLAQFATEMRPQITISNPTQGAAALSNMWSAIKYILNTTEPHYTVQLSAALHILHRYGQEGYAYHDTSVLRFFDALAISRQESATLRLTLTLLKELADPSKRQTTKLSVPKALQGLGDEAVVRLQNYLNLGR